MPVQTIMRPIPTLLFLLLLLGPAAGLPPRQSEITVEDYCRLTQSLMELTVKEWEQRADLAAANKGDRKRLGAKLEEVTRQYRPLREEVYARYGLSPREELRYAGEHQSEIESYLDEHAEVRDSIEALRSRINALIEQVEAAAPAPPQGAQQ